jgi:hypothetical protein
MNTVRNVFICPPRALFDLYFALSGSVLYTQRHRIFRAGCAPFRPIFVLVALAARALALLVSQVPQRELPASPHGSFDAHPPRTARCLAFLFRLPCHAAGREALRAAPDRCELATRKRLCGLVRRLSPSVFGGSRLTRRRQVLAVALSGSRQRLSDVTVWGELLRVTLSENGSEVPS